MIARVLIVFAVVVALIVAAIVFITRSGNERAEEAGTALDWHEEPQLYGLATLPRDRVAIGVIVNGGADPLTMSAGDFQIRDPEGRELDGRIQFIDARRPRPDSLGLGTDVELDPDQRKPLTVSYRLEPRVTEPLTLHFEGAPALPLPDGPVNPLPPVSGPG
jgi:hypothetical protein